MSRLTRTLLHELAETFVKSDGIEAGTRTYLSALQKPFAPKPTNVSDAGPKSEPLARVLSLKLVSRAGLGHTSARVTRDIRRFCQQGKQITRDIPQIWQHKSPNPHLSARFAEVASASLADRWGNRERWSVGARVSRDIRRFR